MCQVRKPPGLPANLPASSPGEFNLACRKGPAAEPAAVDIHHHGIDLPGNFRAVVCLAAPVADERRDIPDDDDPIPGPCDELGSSLVPGPFTERAPLRNHSLLARISIRYSSSAWKVMMTGILKDILGFCVNFIARIWFSDRIRIAGGLRRSNLFPAGPGTN